MVFMKWIMVLMVLAAIQCSSAQEQKSDQNKKDDEFLIKDIKDFNFSRGKPHRRGSNIECLRFSDIGGREVGVIHPYFCKGPAYRANYSSDRVSADVQIILHQGDLAAWIRHDLFWFFTQFIRKENFKESDDTYILKAHQVGSQWIAGIRIQPRRSIAQEKDREPSPSYYDRYLGWVTKGHTLVLIHVWRREKKDEKMPFPDAVVQEYLKKHPSFLQESDFQQDYQALTKEEVAKCIDYLKAGIEVERSVEQFLKYSTAPFQPPITLDQIYQWWDANKEKSPLDWYDAVIEPMIMKLDEVKESEYPRYTAGLSIRLGGIYVPPLVYKGNEGIDQSRAAWKKWWNEVKGKSIRERWKVTVQMYLDYLNEEKVNNETWQEYAEVLKRLDMRATEQVKHPDFSKNAETVKEGIRFWKKWWEENKDTYQPEER